MESEVTEKIEAYINGEMSSEEATAFTNEINKNTTLREQYDLYRQIQSTMQFSAFTKISEQQVHQTITELKNEFITQPKKTFLRLQKKTWYAIAASIVILSVSFFLLKVHYQPIPGALYSQYAVHQPLSVTRGSSDSQLVNAIHLYNNHQYTKAQPLFTNYLTTHTSDVEITIALLICELEAGHYKKSLAGFGKIASTQNVYTYQAVWYAALTNLKQGNIVQCRSLLETIPSTADTYQKAQQLLDKLER